MTTRERPQPLPEAPPASTSQTSTSTDAARDTGDAFLRAADAAMARALSGTPEAFLSQNRQLGGQ